MTRLQILKNTLLIVCSVVCSSAVFQACGDLPGFAVDAKTDKFAQVAVIDDKIDILFVVDNSGSMAEEQSNLASSFSTFINAFADKKLNFHVGVVSTDTTNNTSYWAATGAYNYSGSPYKNFPNAGPGSLLARTGNDRFLTPDSVDYIEQFRENVKLGINGSGAETGVLSATKALSSDFLDAGQWNEGFVRPEAFLSVIYLSDEDESVSASNSHYVRTDPTARAARVKDFEDEIKALKGGDSSLLRVDAIVGPSRSECSTINTEYGLDGTGDVYMQVASEMGGKTSNICRDFSSDLADIGTDLVRTLTRFKLAQKPDGQIEVRVNGTLVPRDAYNGWEYLADTKEVEFRGSAVPSADAEITVTYVPGEPLQ
jgi:hypothetical protein